MRPKADEKKLTALSEEVDTLLHAGRWTRSDYERILAEATKAANGDGDAMRFIQHLENVEWVQTYLLPQLAAS